MSHNCGVGVSLDPKRFHKCNACSLNCEDCLCPGKKGKCTGCSFSGVLGDNAFKTGLNTAAVGACSVAHGAGVCDIEGFIDSIIPGKKDSSNRTGAVVNVASGIASHVEGGGCVAKGNYSHAEGAATQACDVASHSEGMCTIAKNIGAHAEGIQTFATGKGSHSEGMETIAYTDSGHAEGTGSRAYNKHSHAEGYKSLAYGLASHAECFQSVATGDYSHAEGESNIAMGQASHAEGKQTVSSGVNSHSEGLETQAIGQNSHAEGQDTMAVGNNSHAEGLETVASGQNSHAEGNKTQATGQNSHAEGEETQATGQNSHAEGNKTLASGQNSHASGSNTIAIADNMTVVGRSNLFGAGIMIPLTDTPLFVVGNGNGVPTFRDAFWVNTKGDSFTFAEMYGAPHYLQYGFNGSANNTTVPLISSGGTDLGYLLPRDLRITDITICVNFSSLDADDVLEFTIGFGMTSFTETLPITLGQIFTDIPKIINGKNIFVPKDTKIRATMKTTKNLTTQATLLIRATETTQDIFNTYY